MEEVEVGESAAQVEEIDIVGRLKKSICDTSYIDK
jgi:hypothetical protein